MNQGARIIVARKLEDKGLGTFGVSRMIDNFPSNLDLAFDCLMAIYDREGSAERAYYTLRNFLTVSEIYVLNSEYDGYCRRKEAERLRQIAEFEARAYEGEPYEISSTYLGSFKIRAEYALDELTQSIPEREYTISLRDSIFVARDNNVTHKIDMTLSENIEYLRPAIVEALNNTMVFGVKVENSELNHKCNVASRGVVSMKYGSVLKQSSFLVKHKGDGIVELLEGNENEFAGVEREISDAFRDLGKKGKRNVLVSRTVRNGRTISTDVEY